MEKQFKTVCGVGVGDFINVIGTSSLGYVRSITAENPDNLQPEDKPRFYHVAYYDVVFRRMNDCRVYDCKVLTPRERSIAWSRINRDRSHGII